jgi:tRNA (cmo5U34)-methyltransferase
MPDAVPVYRWNSSAAAEAFDAAAEFIHPLYLTIQNKILELLPFEVDAPFLIVDLGAGSGRLIERVLDEFSSSRAVLVDQSGPFLALAERRLQRFGDRAQFVQKRLQDDWAVDMPAKPQAIVSMSAIHHLDSAEKQSLFARCHAALLPAGLFINGDEVRPERDADYLTALQWWSAQKDIALARGQIPASFSPVFDAWHERNLRRFGQPKHSGDDCHETIVAQLSHLRGTGFSHVEAIWAEQLWAIVVACR